MVPPATGGVAPPVSVLAQPRTCQVPGPVKPLKLESVTLPGAPAATAEEVAEATTNPPICNWAKVVEVAGADALG